MILAYKACGHVCYEGLDILYALTSYREYPDTKCAQCLTFKINGCPVCRSISTP